MKIVILTGSPHKAGTSSLLAERFIDGAKEAGHVLILHLRKFIPVLPVISANVEKIHVFFRTT
ncbi:MAG: multimeric flavodoxin WrbA family protein [Firmicutes bacterium]|nr:multimeric flavodoxin WrbA family protein [Bacillota bacterium]